MITRPQKGRIRRVVIGFDPSGEADALLEMAASLAGAAGAEMRGLFVEESALIDLAGLPFARVTRRGGRQGEPIDLSGMERALRHEAQACERALSSHASRVRVSWSFGRARGRLGEALGAAIDRGDLVAVTAGDFGSQPGHEALALARRAAAQGMGVVIVSPRRRRVPAPVVVLDDGDDGALEALEIGARVATVRHEPLVVMIVADSDDKAQQIEQRARETLPADIRPLFRHLAGLGIAHLAAMLRDTEPSLVVGDLNGALLGDDETAVRFMSAAKAPMLLIRPD